MASIKKKKKKKSDKTLILLHSSVVCQGTQGHMQIFFFFQKGAIFFCFSPAVSHANWIRSQMGEGLVWRVGVGGGVLGELAVLEGTRSV